MSSETDHPRQRTVAELLAAHGGSTPASGRRRRRREADEAGADAPAPVGAADAAPETTTALPRTPSLVERGILREPVQRIAPPPPRPVATPRWTPSAAEAAPPRPPRENPTDVIPRVREPQPVEDLTGPLPQRGAGADDGGPPTAVGMAPVGAEDWHAARTATHRGGTAIDGGPPLPAAPPIAGEGPAGLGGAADLRQPDGRDEYDEYDEYDHRAGFDDRDEYDDRDEDGTPPPRERRLGRSAPTSWSVWSLQVLGGALAGAVVWVAFRFLWRSLPVVAVAASAVVVVGLVLVVRAVLHNEDRRTTVFAVLVGLLLTASPAILVLLGR